jgi:hypothetical protein
MLGFRSSSEAQPDWEEGGTSAWRWECGSGQEELEGDDGDDGVMMG